jgi:hypothetical protein
LAIENWSLAIGRKRSMAIYKFSMANFQWPSRLLLQGATWIMFELRLIIGSYFCTEPYHARLTHENFF